MYPYFKTSSGFVPVSADDNAKVSEVKKTSGLHLRFNSSKIKYP